MMSSLLLNVIVLSDANKFDQLNVITHDDAYSH